MPICTSTLVTTPLSVNEVPLTVSGTPTRRLLTEVMATVVIGCSISVGSGLVVMAAIEIGTASPPLSRIVIVVSLVMMTVSLDEAMPRMIRAIQSCSYGLSESS